MAILLNGIKMNSKVWKYDGARLGVHVSSGKVRVQTLRPKNSTSWREILISRCECVSQWCGPSGLKNNMDHLVNNLYLKEITEK